MRRFVGQKSRRSLRLISGPSVRIDPRGGRRADGGSAGVSVESARAVLPLPAAQVAGRGAESACERSKLRNPSQEESSGSLYFNRGRLPSLATEGRAARIPMRSGEMGPITPELAGGAVANELDDVQSRKEAKEAENLENIKKTANLQGKKMDPMVGIERFGPDFRTVSTLLCPLREKYCATPHSFHRYSPLCTVLDTVLSTPIGHGQPRDCHVVRHRESLFGSWPRIRHGAGGRGSRRWRFRSSCRLKARSITSSEGRMLVARSCWIASGRVTRLLAAASSKTPRQPFTAMPAVTAVLRPMLSSISTKSAATQRQGDCFAFTEADPVTFQVTCLGTMPMADNGKAFAGRGFDDRGAGGSKRS
jgi:hypothetical protein